MEDTVQGKASSPHHSHRTLIIILIIVLIISIGAFAFKIYSFYRQIQRGDGLSLARQFSDQLTSSGKSQGQTRTSVDTARLTKNGDASFGHGPITIVQFADFECPFSKKEYSIFRELALKYQNQFTFIFRHFPLETVHEHALDAPLAALCAGEQEKFWPMHDRLYQNNDALLKEDLLNYALGIGMDKNKFVICMETGKYRKKVREDIADAEALGVRGTPTFFINGQKIEGAIPANLFDKILSSTVQSTNTK